MTLSLRIFRSLLTALLLSAPVAAQATQSWWTVFDDPLFLSSREEGRRAGFDPLGRPVAVGFYRARNGEGIRVATYDLSGNLLQRTEIHAGSKWPQPWEALFSPNGEITLCGIDSWGDEDFVVARLGVDGGLLWFWRWHSARDILEAAVQDSEGNTLLTGVTGIPHGSGRENTLSTFKLDPQGNTLWERHYQPNGLECRGKDVTVDSQDYVYVTGYSNLGPSGSKDLLLLKYSPVGDLLWVVSYDGPGHESDIGYRVFVDPQGDVVVGGRVYLGNSGHRVGAFKFDPQGNLLWERALASKRGAGRFKDMAMDATGSVYILSRSADESSFAWQLGKVDPFGMVPWSKVFVRNNVEGVWAHPHGYVCVAGSDQSVAGSPSVAFLAAFGASSGQRLWEDRWDELLTSGWPNWARYSDVAIGPTGAVLCVGTVESPLTDVRDELTVLLERPYDFPLWVGPLEAGGTAEVQLFGAQPGELFQLGYSSVGVGQGPCVGNLCLDLLAPVTVLPPVQAGATGAATTLLQVPPHAPPIPLHFQAVLDRGPASLKSNVVTQTVR